MDQLLHVACQHQMCCLPAGDEPLLDERALVAAMGSDPLPMFRQLHARMAAACTQMAIVVLEKKHKGIRRSTPPNSMNHTDWVRLRLQARCDRQPCRHLYMCKKQGPCFLQQQPELFRQQASMQVIESCRPDLDACLLPKHIHILTHCKALCSLPRPPHPSTLLVSMQGSVCPLHACSYSPCRGPACGEVPHSVPLVHSSGFLAQTLCSWPAGMCCTLACRAMGSSLRQAATSRHRMHLGRYCCCLHPVGQALSLLPLNACCCKLELTTSAGPAAESTAVCCQTDR